MTEKQLRQKVVDTALGYLGTHAGSTKHAEILSIVWQPGVYGWTEVTE